MQRIWLTIGVMLSALALAGVEVPDVFSDHAVLLRSEKTPVFGKGAAGESVKVELGSVSVQTVVTITCRQAIGISTGLLP